MHDGDENNDDSEEEPILVSPGEALKSLKTWIMYFEQQKNEEFSVDDSYIFKKYFNIVKWQEF